MKKAILLVIGVIIAALALVTPLDQVRWIINHGPHQRISVRMVNGQQTRSNIIQLDSATQITTLIIG